MVEKDRRRIPAALTTKLSLFTLTFQLNLESTPLCHLYKKDPPTFCHNSRRSYSFFLSCDRRIHQHSVTTQEEAVASLHSMKEQPSPQPQEKPPLPSSQERTTPLPPPTQGSMVSWSLLQEALVVPPPAPQGVTTDMSHQRRNCYCSILLEEAITTASF